ncbi:MAG TPA: OB-fold nucleic acid binding domain-containing protein, partial [Terrimicrobiaceae bacterium]
QAASLQRDRASGQGALFQELHSAPAQTVLGRVVEPWPRNEMLSYERELLGFYLTGHPLEDYAGHFDNSKITPINAARHVEETKIVRLAGIISAVEKKFTKKDGRPFATVILEDFTGQIEVTAWDEVFTSHAALLIPGAVVGVSARLVRRDEGIRTTVTAVSALKPKASVKPVRLRLAHERLTEGDLADICEAVRRFPGKRPLIIEIVKDNGTTVELRADSSFAIGDESGLRNAVVRFTVEA